MKKFLLLIFSFSMIMFVACGKIQAKPVINNLDYVIASKLQDLDKNYSDETLKALSVVIRNNALIGNTQNFNQSVSDKYLEIARATKNQVLKTQKNDLIEIAFESTEDYTWQKNIKKSEILNFALKNNISLTNLSNIEEVSENGRILGLKIGNKYFDYETLSRYFNLESNQVTNISSSKNEIVLSGKGKGFFNHFDIEKAEQLSKNNYNYHEILNYFFENLELIKN